MSEHPFGSGDSGEFTKWAMYFDALEREREERNKGYSPGCHGVHSKRTVTDWILDGLATTLVFLWIGVNALGFLWFLAGLGYCFEGSSGLGIRLILRGLMVMVGLNMFVIFLNDWAGGGRSTDDDSG